MLINRRQALILGPAALTALTAAPTNSPSNIRLTPVPQDSLQPQVAVDPNGRLHVLYYSGDAFHGDLFYTVMNSAADFSRPLRVNSQPGSAIAAGTIRGGQLALGKGGRPHVAWNGSGEAQPAGTVNPDSGKPGAPMLYSRLNDSGTSFEPQRNVMLASFGLDGGGSVAADRKGNVYIAWHGVAMSEAKGTGKGGEARRSVWITRSEDGGKSFSRESRASSQDTGACGCCGMKVFADTAGDVLALYRSATASVHRDIYLLETRDHGRRFDETLLHKWDINACPMSSMDFAENAGIVAAAWETGGQVYWTRVNTTGAPAHPVPAPGEGKNRKHPRLAINQRGEVLMVWTEGTGWKKGGSFAWQRYEASGSPIGDTQRSPGIPAWSFAAVAAHPDNSFTILY